MLVFCRQVQIVTFWHRGILLYIANEYKFSLTGIPFPICECLTNIYDLVTFWRNFSICLNISESLTILNMINEIQPKRRS